jgi:hypothetical protein
LFGYGTAAAGLGTKVYGLDIRLYYGGTTNVGFVLNSSGNVTIGTSDKAQTEARLCVLNGDAWVFNSGGESRLRLGNFTYIGNKSEYSYLWNVNALDLAFGTNGTERMRINSSGNVTIGGSDLASVGYKLFVDGILGIGGSGNSQWVTRFVSNSEIGLDIQLGRNANNDKLPFSIAWRNDLETPPFTINPNGNVLIGTTTDSGYKLDVNGTGNFSVGVKANEVLLGSAGLYKGSYWSSSLSDNDMVINGGKISLNGAVSMASTLNVTGALTSSTGVLSKDYFKVTGTGASVSGLYTNARISSENYPKRLWLYNDDEVAIYGSEIQLRNNTTINGNLVVAGDISA